jgi:hypothetical protein
MHRVFADFLIHNKIDKLILASAWSEEDLAALSETLDWAKAHGIRTIVIGPIVLYDEMLPRLLFLSMRDGDPGLVGRHRLKLVALDEKLRALAAAKGAGYVSLLEILCVGRTAPPSPHPAFRSSSTSPISPPRVRFGWRRSCRRRRRCLKRASSPAL